MRKIEIGDKILLIQELECVPNKNGYGLGCTGCAIPLELRSRCQLLDCGNAILRPTGSFGMSLIDETQK